MDVRSIKNIYKNVKYVGELPGETVTFRRNLVPPLVSDEKRKRKGRECEYGERKRKRFSALKKADAVAQKELSEDDRTSDTVNGRERTTQPDNSCLRVHLDKNWSKLTLGSRKYMKIKVCPR